MLHSTVKNLKEINLDFPKELFVIFAGICRHMNLVSTKFINVCRMIWNLIWGISWFYKLINEEAKSLPSSRTHLVLPTFYDNGIYTWSKLVVKNDLPKVLDIWLGWLTTGFNWLPATEEAAAAAMKGKAEWWAAAAE